MWTVYPLIVFALVLLVVAPAVRLHWLSLSGAVAAVVVGSVTLTFGGWKAAAVLLTFFTSSSALSRWRTDHKRRMEVLTGRGARRDASQVIANGGVATACIALHALTGDIIWWVAFAGAYAAATADTWSSELGALSPIPPRHILTRHQLRAGDSGGVTPLGFAAAAMGALLIACVASLLYPLRPPQTCLLVLSGFCGSVVDSVLGATVQARYLCSSCGEEVERREHCGQPATHYRGFAWVNNDTVNLFCTLTGALIPVALNP